MARDTVQFSPDEIPEEARYYLTALQGHQGHPFVQTHFFQVTSLAWEVPDHGLVEFFALEFRVGLHAALIWTDGHYWGAGKWLPVSHSGADLTCPPSPLSIPYFQGNVAHATLLGALEQLA